MRKEIQDLLAKKDFSEGLLKLDDPSKVKDYFETKGNLEDVTDDEIKELGSDLENLMQNIAKLPEDKLEKIGGGVGPEDVPLPEGDFDDLFDGAGNDEGGGYDGIPDPEYLPRNKKISGKTKLGIGVDTLGGLAAAGAGVYRIGKTKGWWSKFKRK